MQIKKISENRFEHIVNAANHGSYSCAEATLLTPNLQRTTRVQEAGYLVIESAYTVTVIELDAQGRPAHLLERE